MTRHRTLSSLATLSAIAALAAVAACSSDDGAAASGSDSGAPSSPASPAASADGGAAGRSDAGGLGSTPGSDASTPPPPADAGPGAPLPNDPNGKQAARARDLLDGFGVNTHIDFPGYRTIGVAGIAKAIQYVGNGDLKLLRDSPSSDDDLTLWPQVAQMTGVRFVAFIAEGAPSAYQDNLDRMVKMKSAGSYIFGFEGGNEEDDDYPVSLGNSAQKAAAFQPDVFKAGKQANVPVFQISFGAGWGNSPTGDYGTVGDQSAYADYANAHTYPQLSPFNDVQNIGKDALLTTPGKPVAHTEFGWNTFPDGSAGNGGYGWCSETTCAAYDTMFILDAYQAKCPYYFKYELFDNDALESANSWGLFHDDGTPKQSATAIRVMFQLLGDGAADATSFSPGKLDYSLSGMPAANGGHGGHEALFQRSDGSFWLALWNEQALNDPSKNNTDVPVAAVPVTLKLAKTATTIEVYDVLAQSTTPVKTAANAGSIDLDLPAHPLLVKIVRP